jgi:hypothetical protein
MNKNEIDACHTKQKRDIIDTVSGIKKEKKLLKVQYFITFFFRCSIPSIGEVYLNVSNVNTIMKSSILKVFYFANILWIGLKQRLLRIIFVGCLRKTNCDNFP